MPIASPAYSIDDQGIPEQQVELACYANALAAYGQSGQMSESDWLEPQPIDQRNLYQGNSILRGGRKPVIEERAVGHTGSRLEIE